MGATGYLTKPFNVSEIREIAHNAKENHERKLQHDTSGDKPWHVEK